jgi:hypothetical protein
MKMSNFTNSPLVVHTNLSPNCTKPRNHAIDTITIHCVVGQCTAETLGNIFKPVSRQASSNYGVDKDGRVGMYAEEKDRSWCTSSSANDHRAITIEVASDTTHPYAVNDKALAALIDLCADICKRNGIKKLLWRGDKNLIGQADKQNMSVHRWFANKPCPGDYLYNKHSYIADEVNNRLDSITPAPVPAPSTTPATGVEAGDVVQFTGGPVYSSSNAANATVTRGASRCKVTQTYNGKRPYHLISEDGKGVYGWVDAANIAASGSTPVTPAPASAPVPAQIVAGSKVKIKARAQYCTGKSIPGWVIADTWIVQEVRGDRAVINKNVSGKNAIMSAISTSNLILV